MKEGISRYVFNCFVIDSSRDLVGKRMLYLKGFHKGFSVGYLLCSAFVKMISYCIDWFRID